MGTAFETAAISGNNHALAAFRPDPEKIDMDLLYGLSRNQSAVELLSRIQLPRDMGRVILYQSGHISFDSYSRSDALLATLELGVRWDSAEKDDIAQIRKHLMSIESDWTVKDIYRELKKPEVCAPEVFEELIRTPAMQKRLLEAGAIKPKPPSERELRRREIQRFSHKFDREKLFEEVWQTPLSTLAKTYGVSNRHLARVCKVLRVPAPPRGYWARLRAGQRVKPPKLPSFPV